MLWKNKLFFGDNLRILREHVADESVDLVYLDPPFNSNANYNVLFKEKSGQHSHAQITAFEDTWHWNESAERAFSEVSKLSESDQDVIAALILDELEDERRWDSAFVKSQDQLAGLAVKVRADIAAGRVSDQGFDEL